MATARARRATSPAPSRLSGIESPSGWAGKTAGYKGSQVTPDYLAILAANGVDRASIQEVKDGFEVVHRNFWLFPTYVHQKAADLVPGVQDEFRAVQAAQPDPGMLSIQLYAPSASTGTMTPNMLRIAVSLGLSMRCASRTRMWRRWQSIPRSIPPSRS